MQIITAQKTTELKITEATSREWVECYNTQNISQKPLISVLIGNTLRETVPSDKVDKIITGPTPTTWDSTNGAFISSTAIWQENLGQRSSPLGDRVSLRLNLVSNLGDCIKGVTTDSPERILHIDKALNSLERSIRDMSEGLYCKIRPIPPVRQPGYVIDGWIVIDNYDRELEHKIYKELGEIIRNNTNLLFNIRIIARKGRTVDSLLPKQYRKYSSWFVYIC